LIDKGKTELFRLVRRLLGTVWHTLTIVYRLLDKSLGFLVNLTTGARSAQATPVYSAA
jgi:hypothetical protein